ncbi:ABC transporter substrate-binding protein [Paenibacillus sp. PK3_47]|uniref:ABC transporter substrate-binding protein n=1 Tax=Paenibacillus sp. PK3_47 TaxID=2072642 RepID=UPI00201E2734|nr:ABC transporter substrate-binding protein [Paenibacillus sp. PK3_47]
MKKKNMYKGKVMMTLSLLLAVLLLLGGCGNGQAGSSAESGVEAGAGAGTAQTPSPVPVAENTEAKGSGTRVYTDAVSREVEIPEHPQRIIAHYFAPEMLAIKAPIIGTNYNNAKLSLSDEELADIEDIGGDGINPNTEKMLSLEPDLILLPDFLEAETIEQVAQIAPTVVMSYSEETFARLQKLGDVAGLPGAADEFITEYNAKVEQKREELKPFIKDGETASAFILHSDRKLYVYGPQRLGPTMYEAFGFKQPDKLAELTASAPDALWTEISLEVLPEYAGDHIFLVKPSESEEALKMSEELQNNPVWKNMPAVKNGQAYVVGSRWALNDPLTLDWLLDEMAGVLMP